MNLYFRYLSLNSIISAKSNICLSIPRSRQCQQPGWWWWLKLGIADSSVIINWWSLLIKDCLILNVTYLITNSRQLINLVSFFWHFHKQHKFYKSSLLLRKWSKGVMFRSDKRFVLTEVQTHRPGHSIPMFRIELETTQLYPGDASWSIQSQMTPN